MPHSNPPSQDNLEAIAAPFYRAAGRAMMRWQHVEASLFLLFHAMMRTRYQNSSMVFSHIKSADSKIQLVEKLCRANFTELTINDEWTPILKDLKSAVIFRNGIAHFEANFALDPSVLGPNEPPIVMTPHHLDVASQKNSMVKAATTNVLNEAAEEYLALSCRLLRVVRRHFSLEELRSTDLPQQVLQILEKAQADPPKPPPEPRSSQA